MLKSEGMEMSAGVGYTIYPHQENKFINIHRIPYDFIRSTNMFSILIANNFSMNGRKGGRKNVYMHL